MERCIVQCLKHKNMLIFSHPLGNQNVRAALQGCRDADILISFYTSIATFPNTFLYNIGKFSILSEIRKRAYDAALRSYTHTHPFKEIGRLLSSKLGLNALTRHEEGYFSVDRVSRDISEQTAKSIQHWIKDAKVLYAYEDAALEIFQEGKRLGLLNFYDLPIGYWRAARELMQEEWERRPDWASTLTGFKDSAKKLARKDEELALADHIFVASSFTKKTLESYPSQLAPITVIPYGFPEPYLKRQYELIKDRPLKLLFVGGLSQRKGIANVLEAVEVLGGNVQLTVIGRKAVEDCIPLNEGLKKHRYIPSLPHHEVLREMREHDILLFPSLFEGFGLVITEAMSQGTPVITTDRTVGPDLIEDGKDGWLIPAGSTRDLIDCIERILAQPECVVVAGMAAINKAAQRPWSKYGSELADAIKCNIPN